MIRSKFSRKENVDSGLGLILMLIIVGLWLKITIYFKIAVVISIITMVQPIMIYPFTFLWLNISELLGKIMSKVILTIIFFIVLYPTALYRKIRGKDSLMLMKFKKAKDSVFIVRNHTYTKTDLINPF
jgi:hypothetical protein